MLYMTTTTGVQAENNEEESGNDKENDIKLKGVGNTTIENNKNVIEIDYPILFQIVLDLKKNMFFINNFSKISQ